MRTGTMLAAVLVAGVIAAAGTAHGDSGSAPDGEGAPVEALVERGELAAMKQDWTQAEALFHEALDREPSSLAAWRGLGYVLRKQGRGTDARVAYEKALALAPTDPETLLGLGETYVSVGRAPDAAPLLERLRAVDKRAAATLDWIIRTDKAR